MNMMRFLNGGDERHAGRVSLFRFLVAGVAMGWLALAGCYTADAQTAPRTPRAATAGQTAPKATPKTAAAVNPAAATDDNNIGVISGTVTGTYAQFAADLSIVLDNPGKMRILAILGKGSLQNIDDLLKVRGVDIGIVQSDVLTYIQRNKLYPGIENKMQYITKLYNEEFHILAGADIQSVDDLRGKKVNYGPQGGGMAITTSIVFDLLKLNVEPVYDDPAVALEKLKRGEIAAAAGVYGKPAKIYSTVKKEDNLKFLPVPSNRELSKVYFPTALTSQDYGNLIAPNERVETIAVGAVMVGFGWQPGSPRYTRMARFVDAFFSRIDDFQKPPRHQKWQEVNLAAKVPGWTRFPPAEEWLKRAQAKAEASSGPTKTTQASDTTTPASREKLLREFDEWRKKREAQ